MCVSNTICEENLESIFGLVNKSSKKVPSDVKVTIVCAIGDLVRRFTNTMVDRQENIMDLLRDEDEKVRE